MCDYYKKGFSLSEVAKEFGVTRQAVYAGFKRRGFKMRTKKPREHVIYDGRKFTLRNSGYFADTLKDRQLLHRYKYEKEIGYLPKNWDVHHMDHNKKNNDIDNLVALPKDVHARIFATGGNQFVKRDRRTERLGDAQREINKYLTLKQEFASRYKVDGCTGT